MASIESMVLIDISSSSDEEDEKVKKRAKKAEVISIRSPKGFSVVKVFTKEEKAREDDECCIITIDSSDSCTTQDNCRLSLDSKFKFQGAGEEVAIIAERGKVACRDYPHSRHQCGKYPFDKTPHERCCTQCYCYACDEAAPCIYWKMRPAHCDASDKDAMWKALRFSIINYRGNTKKKSSTTAQATIFA